MNCQYLQSVQLHAPRLAVCVMARNENRRLHDAMRHYCAMFDRVVFVDHCSTDDTARIARSYAGINNTRVVVFRGNDEGHYQSEYMTACARALLAEGQSDWIFFLDVDEFLPFADRAEFERALLQYLRQPVISMGWRNVALREFSPPTLQVVEGFIAPGVSRFRKVALNARLLAQSNVGIGEGNHYALVDGQMLGERGPDGFALFHVPVLDGEALAAKIAQGIKSYDASAGKPPAEGYHWRDMNGFLTEIRSSPALLREVILNYGLPVADIVARVAKNELTRDARKIRLEPAMTEKCADIFSGQPWDAQFDLANAGKILAAVFPACHARRPSPLFRPSCGSLVRPVRPESARPANVVPRAIREASLAKGAHDEPWAPLLLALLEIFRPRLYLELGADAGQTFRIAASHAGANGFYGRTVAVGEWKDEIFAAQRPPSGCRLVRSTGMDWSGLFESSSVDMLSLKKPADHEELGLLYAQWQKMRVPESVLLLWNTDNYDSTCGSWQFYEEIRKDAAAAFRFYGGGGLGVLAWGKHNPVNLLLERLANEPHLAALFEPVSI